jgi:hypothetical protein
MKRMQNIIPMILTNQMNIKGNLMIMSFVVRTLREINQETARSKSFSRLTGLPFWIVDKQEHAREYNKSHGFCCFNHAIKLPEKPIGVPLPIFDYELDIIKKLEQGKHLWIKKASGIGITELCLRYICYKSLCTNDWDNSQVCIVCGNRIDLAITLIRRIKSFFPDVDFDTKETVLELGNNVRIEAFPSHHLAAMRGLTNVKFILISEADFFPQGQQQEARHVSERYIGKSKAQIVMESTPNAPGQLYESIENEEPCLYEKVFLPYTVAVGKMYSNQDILNAQASPSFDREYLLKYTGGIGNLFDAKVIKHAIELGEQSYDPTKEIATDSIKVLGLDPSYSSSKFGYCIAELAHNIDGSDSGQINILMADEFEHPLFNDMISFFTDLIYNLQINRVYVDGANVSFISSLKQAIGENPRYQDDLDYFKQHDLDVEKYSNIKVLPVHFATEHKRMLEHCKHLMDAGCIAIHPSLTKLITALRTATATEFALDKNMSAHNDIFDSFRMCCKYFNIEEKPRLPYPFG